MYVCVFVCGWRAERESETEKEENAVELNTGSCMLYGICPV